MQVFEQQEAAGTLAVKKLRLQKLRDGIPFMINSNALQEGQSYIEFPNGIIQLVSITSGDKDFTLIKELTAEEAIALRKKFNFL